MKRDKISRNRMIAYVLLVVEILIVLGMWAYLFL